MYSSPIKFVTNSELYNTNVGLGNVIKYQGDENAAASPSILTTVSVYADDKTKNDCTTIEADKKIITLALGSLSLILTVLLILTMVGWKRASSRAIKSLQSANQDHNRFDDNITVKSTCKREEELFNLNHEGLPTYTQLSPRRSS